MKLTPATLSSCVTAAAFLLTAPGAGAFSIGDAGLYAILTAPGANNVQLSNSTVNGNWGIGTGGNAQFSSGTVNGDVNFEDAAPGSVGGATVTGSINGNVASVASAWSTVSALASSLGGAPGAALNITGSGQTINVSDGILTGSDSVFDVSGFDLNGGITINGSASDFVVFNFDNGNSNVELKGGVTLTGGITSDRVLFNFTGTGGELKGNTSDTVNGLFLFPNMKLNINGTNINGRLLGGRAGADFQFVSNMTISAAVIPVPAAAWLFGSALGLLGWMRRK